MNEELTQFTSDILHIYGELLKKTPLEGLSDEAKSQVIASLLNSAGVFFKMRKDLELIDAQIQQLSADTEQKGTLNAAQVAELEASKGLKDRQTSALDDAVRRDTAKIACEALSIIKSGGNNAGAWWDVASKALNALSGVEDLANVETDPE